MCEKPLARSAAEAEAIVVKAEERGRVVKTGSNHAIFIRFLVWPQRFVTPPGAPLEAI
jgi:hypothetical protein